MGRDLNDDTSPGPPVVRVFGGTSVETVDGAAAIGGPRQRRLVALLAVRAGDVVDLDWLTEYLWDDDERPAGPERAIRTYVSRIRSALPDECDGWIETTATGYRLAAPPDSVEHLRVARLRADARAARDRNEPTAALRLLDEALGVWRGAPFVELEDLDWVLAVTERLRQDRLEMSEERWETVLALGRHTQITGELAAFVAEHGDRDRAVRHYALALHRSGRSPDALRAIADHRRELVESTGLDPSPAMVELERAILDGDPSLDVDDPGVPLRGYRLLEEAGAGAFSVVWRAVQPSVGRDVAIKQIRAELASRPEFVRRFEAEAQLVARVEHPHIVPLIDYWRDPDSAYLVMRWLPGGTLEERLRGRPLSTTDTLTMVRQVGAALSAAHGHGIVHRDVKPANILFDDAGHAFLTDFGIAWEPF
ncbi:MAG: BTAD domain-containing putative transcriptional regulator, partial [Actinomycetota bacterium]